MARSKISNEDEDMEVPSSSIRCGPLAMVAVRRSWKVIFAVVVPLLLTPLLFVHPSKESKCAYVLLVTALFWMFEPIHLAATALLPVALFPLLGVVSTSEICAPYMKSSVMMFIGGLIMAIAIESCNLHKRVALRVILLIGTSTKRIMLGIMMTTMFLSMWISNTASTAMMVPIADAILFELTADRKQRSKSDESRVSIVSSPDVDETRPNTMVNGGKDVDAKNAKEKSMRLAILLGIAYSANIGGTGTLTGTGTNLVLQGLMEDLYPLSSDLTFANWMLFAVPGMIICVIISWLYLHLFYIGRRDKSNKSTDEAIKDIVMGKYEELGPLTFREKSVMTLFVVLVLLWIFREPKFITGWAELVTTDVKIQDATPAILISIVMFVWPASLSQYLDNSHRARTTKKKDSKRLLDWPTVQKKMQWGVVLLLGGGFALADGTKKSGLSKWLGVQLTVLKAYSPTQAMIMLSLAAAFVTEVASNVATASVVLPVVNEIALAMRVHPLMFMIPVTICISFAFMLPVATPPNAIVFEHLGIKPYEMIKPGLAMNVICVCVQLVMINTWGVLVLDVNHFPQWAEALSQNNTQNA